MRRTRARKNPPGTSREDFEGTAFYGERGENRVDVGPKATPVKDEDRCPRCGQEMDRVLDRGTLCWDLFLEGIF